MYLIDRIKKILAPKYPTLNRIEIFSLNLLDNLKYLQSLQQSSQMIPVLKANAYGHGLKEVATILNNSLVKRVAIDSFPEAQIVNRYFKGKALIIGEMPLEAYNYINWRKTEVVVYNLETLKKISQFGKRANIHLFYNSGMNREGIKDLNSFLVKAEKYLEKVKVVGFCSHLMSAEEDNNYLNREQSESFFHGLDLLKKFNFKPELIHLGNSSAIFSIQDKRLNAFRVGLNFYGYNIFSETSKFKQLADQNLKPALRVVSRVVAIQELRAGEVVSYNGTYQAKKKEKIVIVPFGYYEGLDWMLSNSHLKVQLNKREEVTDLENIARISMNLSNWRLLSNNVSINIGDEIVLISEKKNNLNSVMNIAKLTAKIPYEVLIRLNINIRRVIK
jgi:alanine racemase